MITTIIFDLGGVLVTNGAGRFITHLAKTYHYKESDVDEMIHGAVGSAYRSGKMTSEDFWKTFKDKFPIPLNAAELEVLWESQYELIEETLTLIKELRKTYKVYYLSDTVKKRVDYLVSKYSLFDWFDGGVFSYEIGVRKPNMLMYKKILELAKVSPEEAVFIDDKEGNLVPARELGMKAIHFVTPQQFEQDLNTLLTVS